MGLHEKSNVDSEGNFIEDYISFHTHFLLQELNHIK
jgi:hypothetical protein